MQVSVNTAEGIVVVDGLALKFSFPAPDGVQTIHWAGAHGFGQQTGGVGHGAFRDPAVVAPYVSAWRAEMQARITATEAAEPIELTAYEAYVADEQRRDAERRAAAQADADDASAQAANQQVAS